MFVQPRRPVRALRFTAEQAGSSVKMVSVCQASSDQPVYNHPNERHFLPAIRLDYSVDGGRTWSTFLRLDERIVAPSPSMTPLESVAVRLDAVGDSVLIRAGGTNGSTCSTWGTQAYWTFQATGRVAASGDVTALLDSSGEVSALPGEYLFGCLFKNCTSLTEPPDFPSTSLTYSCYIDVFNGCTRLRRAPVLPARVMAPYCYQRMFSGCSALEEVSGGAMPAETLAQACYLNTFSNCVNLVDPPELPAADLANSCYYGMFSGCRSMQAAPELGAVALPGSCYRQMFSGCVSLSRVKVGFTAWGSSDQTTDWLSGVSSGGVLECPVGLPLETGASRIPSGWTVYPPRS